VPASISQAWCPRVPLAPAGLDSEAWREAWTTIVHKALRQDRRLTPWCEIGKIGDWLRTRHQVVSDARRLASDLGDGNSETWTLLSLAARVATDAAAVEAELDEVCRDVA
jgi:hypothetical protein